MKNKIVLCLLILTSTFVYCQEEKEFNNYQEMRKYFGELYSLGNYREAADLLESVLDKYPDNIMANSFNLAICYTNLKEYDNGIKALQYAFDHKIWFSIWTFEQEIWEPYKEFDQFKKLLALNEEFRQKAEDKTNPDKLIILPEGYNEEKKYPLFIALHGGNGNMNDFKTVWRSDKLEKEFITAYLQSSQPSSMTGYTWKNLEKTKKEVAEAYYFIIDKYPINTEEVIIGGFSDGGRASIVMSLDNVFPLSGFITLCPPKPESFSNSQVKSARHRGLRCSIITSEMDPSVPMQKEMIEIFKSEGLDYQFIVTPNIGHWFPEDFDKKIDKAIDHIRGK